LFGFVVGNANLVEKRLDRHRMRLNPNDVIGIPAEKQSGQFAVRKRGDAVGCASQLPDAASDQYGGSGEDSQSTRNESNHCGGLYPVFL